MRGEACVRKDLPPSRLSRRLSRVKFQSQRSDTLLEPPKAPPSRRENVLLPGGNRREDAIAQPAPERSPSTTPHRNLRAPPAAPATAAPPAPAGLSSPGAGAAGGSNDAPAETAGLELSSLSRSSSAAWLSFCTILLPPAAATSAGPPRPPSVGPPARSPRKGLGSKRAPFLLLPLPLYPSPSLSAGTRMPGWEGRRHRREPFVSRCLSLSWGAGSLSGERGRDLSSPGGRWPNLLFLFAVSLCCLRIISVLPLFASRSP